MELNNEQLVQYLLNGIPIELIRNNFKVSDDQLIRAIVSNPNVFAQLQQQAIGRIQNVSQYNPNEQYGTGILPFAAVINPTEQKYESLGQVSKDYFDAISQIGNNPEELQKLRELYQDSDYLKSTYGQEVDTSGMIADTQNFLDDEVKRSQAGAEAQYNAWAKEAEQSGLVGTGNPLAEYFKQRFGVAELGQLPRPDMTWAEYGRPERVETQFAETSNRLGQQLGALAGKGAKEKFIQNYIQANTKPSDMGVGERIAAGFGNLVSGGLDKLSGLASFGFFPDLGTELLGPQTPMVNAPSEEEALKVYTEQLAKARENAANAKKNEQDYNNAFNFWSSYLTGGKTPYQISAQQLLGFLGKK
jgi:hypothetical protein